MSRTLKYLAAFLCLLLPLRAEMPTPAAAISKDGLQRLDAVLRASVDKGGHAGAIWLIARNGTVVDCQAPGYRDLAAKLTAPK